MKKRNKKRVLTFVTPLNPVTTKPLKEKNSELYVLLIQNLSE
jgi:hypothetical protein